MDSGCGDRYGGGGEGRVAVTSVSDDAFAGGCSFRRRALAATSIDTYLPFQRHLLSVLRMAWWKMNLLHSMEAIVLDRRSERLGFVEVLDPEKR